MVRKRPNGTKNSKGTQSKLPSGTADRQTRHNGIQQAHHHHEWFGAFAHHAARYAGKPITFIAAVLVVAVWAATGPFFNYSDTWQLVINTSTTIITFLMVFLIQNTQNRDTLAIQIKLAELIIAVRGAHNSMAIAEDMTEEDLESLHEEYRHRAEVTLESLEQRRAARAKK